MREYILKNKLQHLFSHYHVVLFDCPPNLSKVTINALMASEEVVVPVETQSYSIKAISDLTNTFALIRSKMNHTLRVWILPTKVDRRVRLANDFLQALDRHFGSTLLDPISVDANVVKAPMIYEPVTRSFPATRAAREYLRLARFLSLPDAERDAYRPVPDRFVGVEEEFEDPFAPAPETDPSLYDERTLPAVSPVASKSKAPSGAPESRPRAP
jgi:MinD-like ATPase involved in chromosome partitioning or flagellar assembly